MKLVVSKKFRTSVERTPRVLEVAEAYGLGLSDKEFTIFNDVEIEINRGDVVYITGQSGSGKSILLREIKGWLHKAGWSVADLADISFDERPLIEQVGETMSEASALLSQAGINDAYLAIRKPSELSDGQRYRLKLARLIESGADCWLADEFGAVLDRVTAKVVAFNMQKVARKLKRTLIVATTHTDLEEELGPDLVIEKRYHDRVRLRRK